MDVLRCGGLGRERGCEETGYGNGLFLSQNANNEKWHFPLRDEEDGGQAIFSLAFALVLVGGSSLFGIRVPFAFVLICENQMGIVHLMEGESELSTEKSGVLKCVREGEPLNHQCCQLINIPRLGALC